MARDVYIYFLAKLSELLDTVFFVLRKKEKQITFLHMYHHTVMPMVSWGATKYYPGGHGIFVGTSEWTICNNFFIIFFLVVRFHCFNGSELESYVIHKFMTCVFFYRDYE